MGRAITQSQIPLSELDGDGLIDGRTIDAMMTIICSRPKFLKGKRRVAALGTYEAMFGNWDKTTEKTSIIEGMQSADLIFMPANENDNHWVLYTVDIKEKTAIWTKVFS